MRHTLDCGLRDADSPLARLLLLESGIPWYRSLYRNVRELLDPPELSPLVVTSRPVAVKDIWEADGNKKTAGVSSLSIHAGVVALLFFLGTSKPIQDAVKHSAILFAPVELAPLPPDVVKLNPNQAKRQMGGGGGGGDRSPLPSSIGRPPRFAARQFTPPAAVPANLNPILMMEPTLVVQPDAPVPNINMAQIGNPWGVIGPPSNGRGKNGGIGEGDEGGVGNGTGPGLGPGANGNTGGGAYRLGAYGITRPVALFQPEPEYSEEARKAKYQGTVLLYIEIDGQGRTRNLKVVRPLGLGLDEKAIEAVAKWRFTPAKKDGRPVAVGATVEVNFRLL